MYGHRLRRDARLDRTEVWSEVRPGSLYGALHRLADRVRALPARAARFNHQRDRMWPGQAMAGDLVVEQARLRVRDRGPA